METALGLIESHSLAQGALVADAVLKTASVRLLCASAVSPGKLLIGFDGGVAEVEAAASKGLEVCGDHLEDALFIPRVHRRLGAALMAELPELHFDAMGIVETATVAAAIRAADASLKAAAVELLTIRLGAGIGGKAVYYLAGSVADVNAAVEAGAAAVRIESLLVNRVVIPAPHADLARYFESGAGRWAGLPGVVGGPGEES